MNKPEFLRSASFIGPEQLLFPIHIIGCGASGSHTALLLAKMGAQHLILQDHDTVSAHNLPNQTYDAKHVDMYKVDALEEVIKAFNPTIRIEKNTEFFSEPLGKIVVICTDNMLSRSQVNKACYLNFDVELVVDIRLGFELADIYIVKPLDLSKYNRWTDSILDDSLVPEGPCTRKICTTLVWSAVSYAVHMICCSYSMEGSSLPIPENQKIILLNNRLRTIEKQE